LFLTELTDTVLLRTEPTPGGNAVEGSVRREDPAMRPQLIASFRRAAYSLGALLPIVLVVVDGHRW